MPVVEDEMELMLEFMLTDGKFAAVVFSINSLVTLGPSMLS